MIPSPRLAIVSASRRRSRSSRCDDLTHAAITASAPNGAKRSVPATGRRGLAIVDDRRRCLLTIVPGRVRSVTANPRRDLPTHDPGLQLSLQGQDKTVSATTILVGSPAWPTAPAGLHAGIAALPSP